MIVFFFEYVLFLLAGLCLLLAYCYLHQQTKKWHPPELTLRTCKHCKYLFAVGRFHQGETVSCPRCGESVLPFVKGERRGEADLNKRD